MASLFDHLPAWLQRAVRPLLRAFALWSEAGGSRMAAAMSFYGILSLAPLLIVMVAILGWWLDRSALESGLVEQIGNLIGPRGTAVIQQALSSATQPKEGLIASVLGFGVLLFGATGIFRELQEALERLWLEGSGNAPPQQWWRTATLRLRGVSYVLALGFLLLVSMVLSTLLELFADWAGTWLPLQPLLVVVNEVFAFVVCAALFVAMMRLSVGPKPRTRYLVLGACIAATLFTVARHALSFYLASAAVVSAYGAAGSLIVLLMWIYFSSAILLLGAGCARALEEAGQEQEALEQAEARGEPADRHDRAPRGSALR